jgi:hypothetical protein
LVQNHLPPFTLSSNWNLPYNTQIVVRGNDNNIIIKQLHTVLHFLLAYFSYFEKIKEGVCDLHPVFVSVNLPYQLLNAWTNLYETWYIYNCNWANLNGVLHKSLLSVCVSLCVSLLSLLGNDSVKCILPFGARQRLGIHVLAVMNTRNNRRITGRMCLWDRLCILLSLLGNNSVKSFPRQWRIVGGVVFCAVLVVPKESRRLVLPRTSYNNISKAYVSTPLLVITRLLIQLLKTYSCMHVSRHFGWNV